MRFVILSVLLLAAVAEAKSNPLQKSFQWQEMKTMTYRRMFCVDAKQTVALLLSSFKDGNSATYRSTQVGDFAVGEPIKYEELSQYESGKIPTTVGVRFSNSHIQFKGAVIPGKDGFSGTMTDLDEHHVYQIHCFGLEGHR